MLGLARYEIVRKVADGSTAETFLARAAELEHPVILKVFKPRDRSEAVIARLMRQLEACREIHHPSIVEHFESGRLPGGRPYLAIEHLEGEDLATHLRRDGPLSTADLIRIVVPVCELLEYLAARGVFYPELRASDVFLAGGLSRFEPKLLDAGRAWLGNCGIFRPLECGPGEDGGLRAEVFGLGVLMYEALEGQPPFIDDERDPWVRKFDASLSLLRGRSVALMGIIDRCLCRDPRDRFASPEELARSITAGWSTAAAISTGAEPATESLPPAEDLEREKVGDLLGNYHLEKLLGEGSMGRVFLARHRRLGRAAAIKVMRPEYARSPQFIERFFQEAKAVNQISHEHIVEVFDFVDERTERGRRVYCVMEMLEGTSLTELLSRETLSVERSLGIARQLCAGLDAAHRLGVVHRDIKPDNIFITDRQGVADFVKIVDFGVAKVLSPTMTPNSGKTIEGIIVGTPSYMAPEQAAGFSADRRSDIYSVGAVCYEMLAGRVPFEGASFGQLMAKVIAQPAPMLPALTPCGERIPPELAALVMRCLEKDPKRRPQTVAQLRSAFSAIPAAPSSSTSQHFWKWVGVGAGASALAAAAVIAAVRLPDFDRAEAPTPRAELRSTFQRSMARMPPSSSDSQVVNVRIASEPPGARVIRTDSGTELGFTPLYRPFSRTETDVVLRLELPGHKSIEQTIHPAERPSLEVTMSKLNKQPAKKRQALRGFTNKIGRDGLINPFEK